MILCALVSVGCTPHERVVYDYWGQFADNARAGGATVTVGGRQDEAQAGASGSGRRGAVYTVFLSGHEGDDRMRAAFRDASWLRGELGVPDVWFADADGVAVVYAGRFRRQDDPGAKQILRAVRSANHGDEKLFADAKVVEVYGGADEVASNPLDLRGYRGRFGYTLQVGFFDAAYGGDRRKAAEEWAGQIREEHEDVKAFYYHGPHRSMVTIGLFTKADFVRKGYADAWGPSILAAQKKFPHNLGNGMTLIERTADGESQGEQPSCLVRIPR